MVTPRAVPHVPGHTIGDYLRSAGGLTDDGAPSFTVIDVDHRRSRGDLNTRPEAGSTILAEKHGWSVTTEVIAEATTVVTFAVLVLNFVIRIVENRELLGL